MSTISLCIGYAHKSCTTELVMHTFEKVLEDTEIVHRVDVIDKLNTITGESFKVFFIHFAFTNTALLHMLSRIEQDEFFIITYGNRIQRKTGAIIDTFWKVSAFKTKNDDFKPRILSVEEAEIAGIKPPK